jgi:purine-binding chemotaxis protein CheW
MQTNVSQSDEYIDFVIFHIGNIVCGIDIMQIQEIKRLHGLTPVPRSPRHIRGVVNMRGQIVTAIDLRQRLDLEPLLFNMISLAIIVQHKEELIGLLIDEVDDVVRADTSSVSTPPSNICGVYRHFFHGILKLDETLVAILDKDKMVETTDISDKNASVLS